MALPRERGRRTSLPVPPLPRGGEVEAQGRRPGRGSSTTSGGGRTRHFAASSVACRWPLRHSPARRSGRRPANQALQRPFRFHRNGFGSPLPSRIAVQGSPKQATSPPTLTYTTPNCHGAPSSVDAQRSRVRGRYPDLPSPATTAPVSLSPCRGRMESEHAIAGELPAPRQRGHNAKPASTRLTPLLTPNPLEQSASRTLAFSRGRRILHAEAGKIR